MAGEAAEAKITGRALVPPVTKICDAVQSLRRNETLPTSDVNNVARALASEQCDEIARELLTRRTHAIQALLDRADIWAKVEAVAVALVDQGELSGLEVEALIAAADQQLQRDTIFRLVHLAPRVTAAPFE